jgi:hypothetical protein
VSDVAIPLPLFPDERGDVDESSGRTRRHDHSTSRAGAETIQYRAGSQKALLLAAYVEVYPAGLTDEEAAKWCGLFERPTACWWKRSNELRQDEMIVPTGEQRVGDAGTPRMVCVAAQRVARPS